jgi:transglutaminase-like putative cysteine protease
MSIPADLAHYLRPSQFIDSEHPDIVQLTQELIDTGATDVDSAVTLYYWVRDDIRYNPYVLSSDPREFLASSTLAAREGWCVTKALLLAALCRAARIPARVGFADVRNHLSTERLRATMQTDIFYFHGYTSIYLEERWVKATPAFNIELCQKFGLRPLEFNGRQDSLYHEFDMAGNRHMEYVNDRGEHLDLPFDEMAAIFREHYPAMFKQQTTGADTTPDRADWAAEVDREVGLG